MPIRLNVGISKKIGLPDYGSVGASCSVEVELDTSLLGGDLSAFHERVQRAYAACGQAVTDELARQRGDSPVTANGSAGPQAAPSPNGNGNGHHGNGHAAGANGSRASQKQMDYLRRLAGQVSGLGIRRLESLAQKVCGKLVAELTTLDASSLIDTIKAVKDGRLSLDALNSESVP